MAERERSLLVGDINYPKMNWDELDASGDGEAFLDIVKDNCFMSACDSDNQRK